MPADTEIKYSVELLDVNVESSMIEVLYVSEDPQDDDVAVYIKIKDPVDKASILQMVKVRAPVSYWMQVRTFLARGLATEVKDSDIVVPRKGSAEAIQKTADFNKLIGTTIEVTASAGQTQLPEVVGDLFLRNKLREDLATSKAGEI